LVGDAGKALRELQWSPKVFTPDLARIMVDADVEMLKSQSTGPADRPFSQTR